MRKGFETKKLKKIQNVLTKTIRIDGIKPFTERPSVDPSSSTSGLRKNDLSGADLFSLFTADIIREEVLFTR
jgi:hypothetical protein